MLQWKSKGGYLDRAGRKLFLGGVKKGGKVGGRMEENCGQGGNVSRREGTEINLKGGKKSTDGGGCAASMKLVGGKSKSRRSSSCE